MAGRRLRVVWEAADTAEALRRAYRAEAEGAVRMRLHGLWLLRSGRSVGEVANTVGVHERTVQRWVRWYEAGGLAAVRSRHQGGAGPQPRLTAAQQEHLAAEVASGRFRAVAAIRQRVAEVFGVPYTEGGMYTLLARLKCAPKVPRPLPATADLAAQERFNTGGLAPLLRRPA